jgi:hypothetical protein
VTEVYDATDALPGGNPEDVRTVQVRLSVRAPRSDRSTHDPANPDFNPVTPTAAEGGVFRFSLGTTAGAGFARVRTLVTDVQLPNLNRVTW